ncbi:DUF4476 domain-containing protein [Pyxidicoccus xibeiensis]|uniref:DUF4476 domain-containing protein n=1 Tax=Pyxidicoccus xibeiensis TaxID=2906759 RepID=UPI0020A778E2|nr:DUF4476 domain-containing protein [Pyxidicoccus xibeiensis]MCP3140196.1 DUF4476 domain-containing protein [Pyxidicoccus xibeiensis]
MKALTLAVALLTASSALAQDEAEKQGAELRRNPPPGRPMPQPQQPPRSGNLAVVDRDELNARLARLEKLLEDAEKRLEEESRYSDRDRDRRGRDQDRDRDRDRDSARNKVRKAQETLDSVQQFVTEAPHLGTVYPAPAPRPPPPPPMPVVQPMPEGPFKRLNEAVKHESFTDDKMRIITMAAGNNHFLISQVGQLLSHFAFSQDKLAAVRTLKPRILDPENGYQLYSVFSFSSDKKQLQEILAQR